MAIAAGRDQGKTAFVREVLAKNERANARAVNDAWREAGREGKISTTLVQTVRSDLGLTGNIRPGRGASKARADRPRSRVDARAGRGTRRARSGRTAESNGRRGAPGLGVAPARAADGERTRVLTALEGGIDDMLFEVKRVGGLPEFEEVLRKARRILARNHRE